MGKKKGGRKGAEPDYDDAGSYCSTSTAGCSMGEAGGDTFIDAQAAAFSDAIDSTYESRATTREKAWDSMVALLRNNVRLDDCYQSASTLADRCLSAIRKGGAAEAASAATALALHIITLGEPNEGLFQEMMPDLVRATKHGKGAALKVAAVECLSLCCFVACEDEATTLEVMEHLAGLWGKDGAKLRAAALRGWAFLYTSLSSPLGGRQLEAHMSALGGLLHDPEVEVRTAAGEGLALLFHTSGLGEGGDGGAAGYDEEDWGDDEDDDDDDEEEAAGSGGGGASDAAAAAAAAAMAASMASLEVGPSPQQQQAQQGQQQGQPQPPPQQALQNGHQQELSPAGPAAGAGTAAAGTSSSSGGGGGGAGPAPAPDDDNEDDGEDDRLSPAEAAADTVAAVAAAAASRAAAGGGPHTPAAAAAAAAAARRREGGGDDAMSLVSCSSVSGLDMVVDRVRDLAANRGDRQRRSKRERAALKGCFRELRSVMEDGRVPEQKIKLRHGDTLLINTMEGNTMMNYLKRFLAGGFQVHLQANPFLHSVFGFTPLDSRPERLTSQEKRFFRSPCSAASKARSQARASQRAFKGAPGARDW